MALLNLMTYKHCVLILKLFLFLLNAGMAKETAQPQGLSGNYGLKNSFQYPQITLGIPQH